MTKEEILTSLCYYDKRNPDNEKFRNTQVNGLSLADIDKRTEELYLKEKVPEADKAAFYQGYRYGLADMIAFYTR